LAERTGNQAIEQELIEPGTVLAPAKLPSEAGSSDETFAVQTGDGALAILRLQKPGGKPMSGLDFLRGQRDFIDARLGG
jgi:methionyl-tRNA formyltransferase